MKLHIFTTVMNRPDFLEIQAKMFEKYLKDDYELHVVDDTDLRSKGPKLARKFKSICDKFDNLTYHKTDPKPNPLSWPGIINQRKLYPNRNQNLTLSDGTWHPCWGCAYATQWTYDNLIKKNHREDKCILMDADMFLFPTTPIEEYPWQFDEKDFWEEQGGFSLLKYFEGQTLSGVVQGRGSDIYKDKLESTNCWSSTKVTYIWNGLVWFDMSKICEIDDNLDWNCGIFDDEPVDVGGQIAQWLRKHNEIARFNEPLGRDMKEGVAPNNNCSAFLWHPMCMRKETSPGRPESKVEGEAFERLGKAGKWGEVIFHYRGGGNWTHPSLFRKPGSPIPAKQKLFEEILEQHIDIDSLEYFKRMP